MAGVGYTFGPDRTLFNFSVVAGPSFNSAKFDDEFIERISSLPTIEADNSLAIRPGFSITHTLAPRRRPHRLCRLHVQPSRRSSIATPAPSSTTVACRLSFVLSVGVVYSIF